MNSLEVTLSCTPFCKRCAPTPKIGKLIYEPDGHQLLSRATIVFPDQCQDLCSDHHTGTVLMRLVLYSWREVQGVTRSRGIALALFTMSSVFSADLEGSTKGTNEYVVGRSHTVMGRLKPVALVICAARN